MPPPPEPEHTITLPPHIADLARERHARCEERLGARFSINEYINALIMIEPQQENPPLSDQ